MPSQPYTIEIDEDRRLVKLKLFGLWDLAILDDYVEDAQAAFQRVRAAKSAADGLRVLIDLRDHSVQSREVAERIQEQLSTGIPRDARYAVLLSHSMLHRMQAQRVGSHLGEAFFTVDEGEAIAWLMRPMTSLD